MNYFKGKSTLSSQKRLFCFLFLMVVCVVTILTNGKLGFPNYRTNLLTFNDLYRFYKENEVPLPQSTKHPYLKVNDSSTSIMDLIEDVGSLNCGDSIDWVHVDGSRARVSEEARKRFGEITCKVQDILRMSDFTNHYGKKTKLVSQTEYEFKESDFAHVSCRASSGNKWRSVLAGIRHDPEVLRRSGGNGRLNVLMWGFDSLSRNMFARKLPRSLRYLRDKLGAFELRRYNIVGGGTPGALIPILTGKTERELPDTRRRMGKLAQFVNVYPFVWNDFQANGYVTAFAEDDPQFGCFTYRLKGFRNPPTDHYMRTFYNEVRKVVKKHKPYCLGSTPRHRVLMNYVHDFFKVYTEKPKFMFAFHGELSHSSYKLIGYVDEDFRNWLRSLHEEGVLNSTLLIVMSDHGHRLTKFRNTLQGKLEERLPMFSLVFPEWFIRLYPQAIANLRKNVDRLTTPFDVYPTFLDVVYLNGSHRFSSSKRSISLFRSIPIGRTCSDASIEPHWCANLDWQRVDITDRNVERTADVAVGFMNNITSQWRDICSSLKLDSVLWAFKLKYNEDVLGFRNIGDAGGLLSYFLDTANVSNTVYQLKILVQPGAALYEITMTHDREHDSFLVKESDISRINSYEQYASCVEDLPHLRKYCFCLL